MLRPFSGFAFFRRGNPVSQAAAASSQDMPAGLCARAPCSRTQMYSALAPPLMPKTSSPTSNSALPRQRLPPPGRAPCLGIRRFGRSSPMKMRRKRIGRAEAAVAPVTDVACTLTSTSSSFGNRTRTSSSRGPAAVRTRSCTTASCSLPLPHGGGSVRRAATPVRPGRVSGACRRSRLGLGARSDYPAVLGDDAAAEVGGVELHAPDGLVHCPQLGHRERRPHERGRDETSSSTRTRSIASRTMRRWSNASSSCSLRTSEAE